MLFCLLIALALQGCGGGSTSGAPQSPSQPGSGTTPTPPVTPVVPQLPATYEAVASYSIAEEGKAAGIVEKSGISGGLILQIHCSDPAMLEQLKVDDRYLVQGLDVSDENVLEARRSILAHNGYGTVSAVRFNGTSLPYIDNLANLVVSEDLGEVAMSEVMRVLAPDGVAMILQGDLWKKYVKQRPAEMDEWTHYLYDASGNPVSQDTTITPIKHYQWIGSPRWARHHDTTASMSAMVSANGRIFYILDEGPTESIELPAENYLVARDAFNGTILWKRPIPEWEDQWFALKSGPAYLPRRLVAAGNSVFVTLGINAPLSELDAATGATIRTFPQTEQTSEVLFSDNTLFLVVGRPEKTEEHYVPKDTFVWDSADYARSEWAWDGRIERIAALSYQDGAAVWTKDYPVAPLSLTADSNSVYFYDGARLVCLDRRTGDERWQSAFIPTRPYSTAYAPRIIAWNNVILFSSGLQSVTAFSAATGQRLWAAQQPASGHYSPEDMFVIDNTVWTGATADMSSDGTFTGRSLFSGLISKTFGCDVDVYWFHQRCYPSKATKNYIIPSRTGIEFVDLDKEHWTINHYARGGCFYGVMPGNGLIYTPPNACACYMEAKLNGFCALGGAYASEPDLSESSTENRLETGPAFGAQIEDNAGEQDWPTYRHDAGRSGHTASAASASVSLNWKLDLGGRLSSPVVAGGRMYVSAIDSHTVYAIDAFGGNVLWSYTAGARVDSPPTIYKGRVLFGSNDGYVYCLRAADGALVWRYRAAPAERRMVAYEQVESVWPVHGSVLVEEDRIYCVAGRSMFLDGGMRLVQLNPETGTMISEAVLDEKNPYFGDNLQAYIQGLDMPVGLSDILSSDGQFVYMRSQEFTLTGSRLGYIRVRNVTDQLGDGAHVFSPVGFLDDSQFARSYMMYGKTVKSGWGGWEVMGKFVPSGRLIVVDDQNVYGYGRKPEFLSESMVLEYQLFKASKAGNQAGIQHIMDLMSNASNPFDPSFMNYAGDWKLRQGIPMSDQSAVSYQWRVDKPGVQARAMVLAGDTLFVAGPPDIVDEESAFFALDDADVKDLLAMQSAALDGADGARLWALSTADGRNIAEYRLDSLPVWDGMIVAGGKLYMTTMKGEAICLSE